MPSAQTVMLAVHSKRTEPVELKSPILAYIRSTYSDKEADNSADDLTVIQNLRNEIAVATGAQPTAKDSLLKYLKYLNQIETRFPIGRDKANAQVIFSWYDAFRPQKKVSQNNIHLEKASVLFNLGAILSQQALNAERGTSEGLSSACKCFMESSGAFQVLREQEAAKIDSPRPVDTSPECAVMLDKLMLAQAQECVYRKAELDGKSASVLSRLAKQASIMYSEVEQQFQFPSLQQHFEKSWVFHTQLKSSLYDVESLIQQAKQYRTDDKIAFEIAVLQEAFKRLQNTKKISKNISQEMYDSVGKVQDVIQLNLGRAERDNGTIYLERVPPFTDVPPVQGACLVKSAPPNLDSVQTETLFATLIPDTSAKALSKYTDMVDSLIREQLDKVANATDQARTRLRELELPDMLDALDAKTSASLPDGVYHELEEISSCGGVAHLKGILAEIGEIRKAVDEDMAACQSNLDNDSKADSECRTKYGDRWTATPSATVTKPYWDRIATYRASLSKAGESDKGVMERMAEHEEEFSKLTPTAAAGLMPRLEAPMVNTSSVDPAVLVASLRRNLEGLQGLANDRSGIEAALKETKKNDNVLPKLMATSSANYDALFATELKKYDGLKEDVAKNVQAQDQMLAAVAQEQQGFKTVFDVAGWRQRCDAAASGVRESCRLYRELLDHLSEGLRFYIGIQEVVRKCRQEVADFEYTRQMQRDELKAGMDRRARDDEAEKLARQMQMAGMGGPRPPPPPQAYPATPAQPQYAGAPGQPPPHGYAQPPAPHGSDQVPPPPQPVQAYGTSGSHTAPPPPPQYTPPQYSSQQSYAPPPYQPPQYSGAQQYPPQQQYAPPPPQQGGYPHQYQYQPQQPPQQPAYPPAAPGQGQQQYYAQPPPSYPYNPYGQQYPPQ